MIIDGGPNSAILSEIGKLMSWYDRYIDVILITNPDVDHYGGFIDLLKRYKVGLIILPDTTNISQSYKMLNEIIAEKNIKKITVKRGERVMLGRQVYFDVLFPDRDVPKLNPNEGSIVGQLVYGSSTIMFTGDSPNATQEFILMLDGVRLKSDILKVGHHGSRTSASESFVSGVAPNYAIISAGLNNRYGHPHKETVDLLEKLKIKQLTTFGLGTIIFKSDGREWKNNIQNISE
jgi:competence protein ComEC